MIFDPERLVFLGQYPNTLGDLMTLLQKIGQIRHTGTLFQVPDEGLCVNVTAQSGGEANPRPLSSD